MVQKNKNIQRQNRTGFKHSLAALITSLWTAACGPTVNNFYGTEEEQPMEYENPCGNSSAYGMILWEISGCKLAINMREDCRVGVTGFNRESDTVFIYNFEDRGYGFESLKYEGRENGLTEIITSPANEVLMIFDPTARILPHVVPKWQELNRAMDLYDGHMKISENSSQSDVDDSIFIDPKQPFPGEEACEKSPFYVGWQ